jgi:hypothetical protein
MPNNERKKNQKVEHTSYSTLGKLTKKNVLIPTVEFKKANGTHYLTHTHNNNSMQHVFAVV